MQARLTASSDSRAQKRRMLLFLALVVAATVSMALPTQDGPPRPLLAVGPIEIFSFDLLVLGAVLLGAGVLLRTAGDATPSLSRFTSRLLLAYLLYQLLVVMPVALWMGEAPPTAVVRGVGVRFDWILFPALLVLFRDGRMRRAASWLVVAAAAVLALWGAYLAATGGGGFYADDGGVRYRILTAIAPPLFLWPLALAVSGAMRGWGALALVALALVGQTLTGFRSALVAGLGAAFVGLLTSKRWSNALVWTIPGALVVLILMLLWGDAIRGAYGYILAHLLDLGSSNAVDRLYRWQLASDFIRAKPFNDYVWSWQRYLVHLTRSYEPHNFVLEIGTNEGIVGLAFYATLFVALARTAWKPIWADAETRALSCFMVAYLVFAAGNTTWYQDANMPLLVAAVAGLVARLDELQAPAVVRPVEAARDGQGDSFRTERTLSNASASSRPPTR